MASQSLLVNSDNVLKTSTLQVTSTKSAEHTITQRITNRIGSGQVVLSGAFTGENDSTLDLLIFSDNSSALPRVSSPVFAGAGNGTLEELSVDAGAVSEKITITLTDTGTKTKAAELDFFGVKLVANLTGNLGNSISLEVDTSEIVKNPTNFSTLDDISAGTDKFDSSAYNFGAYPLNGDGTLNSNTKRLVFGDDPTIYRMYSKFEDGKTIYYIDPPVVYDIPKSTPLKQVTGTYTLTISDGTTTETFEDIITLYDALIKIKSLSNLVEVDGVVIDDRTPGGMSVDEFPLRTSSYALPPTFSGSEFLTGLDNITISQDASGQLLEIKCVDNTVVGAEKWAITAPSDGGLLSTQAITSALYSTADYSFSIPRKVKDNPTDTGMKLEIKEIRFASRNENEEPIQICVDVPTCGINAEPKTITCVYTKVPDDKCDCLDATYDGKLNEDCLGIEIDGGSNMALDAEYQSRLSSLYSWRKGFMRNNTALVTSSGGTRSAFYDLELCDKITEIFADCLAEIYDNATARTEYDARFSEMTSDITSLATLQTAGSIAVATPGVTYTEGDFVVPPAHLWTGHKYIADSRTTNIYLSGGGAAVGVAGILGYDLIKEWPTDGGQTELVRHDVFGPSSGTNYVGFTDAGPLGDNDIIYNNDSGAVRNAIAAFVRRYSAAMDYTRVLAGIIPKSEGAGTGGNECWRPLDVDYYWTVNGLEYLPCFSNTVYHSSKGQIDGSVVNCTKEFAFVIKVSDSCAGGLKEGDTVVLEITGENVGNKTYEINDIINLPIIAGQPVFLAGGTTGNDTLKWSVKGSVTGVMSELVMTGNLSNDYNSNYHHFRLKKGAIDFALNDVFTFSVESGTYKYRFGNAAYSAERDIPASAELLANGISATFVSGSTPSFVANDLYSFDIKQPYSYEAIRQPGFDYYSWTGTGTTITADFGSNKPVSSFAIAYHTLPATAGVKFELFDVSDVLLLSKTLDWNDAVIMTSFAETTARKAKITISNATGGSIGWCFVGKETTFTYDASNIKLNLIYDKAFNRGSAGEIEWSVGQSHLTNDDYNTLKSKINYIKENYNQPIVFVPNKLFPEESRLVEIETDEISFSEYNQFAIRNKDERKISASIPFRACYR